MQENWQDKRQRLLSTLFKALDSSLADEDFRSALADGSESTLIAAVANYFRRRPALKYYENHHLEPADETVALDAAAGKVRVVAIPHCFPAGKIDWYYNVTDHNGMPHSNEWQWQLNRMYFWREMAKYYLATGDETMAAAFNSQLAGWIEQTAPPEDDVNTPGSAWRTIETGLRLMDSWPESFEFFRKSEHFTDENICLMLASMYEQAEFLQKEEQHVKSNWMFMEMQGLYAFGAFFPEFSASCNFRKYAADLLSGIGMEQILPDGMQSELSPGYHWVVVNCSLALCNMAVTCGFKEDIPEGYQEFLQNTFLGLTWNMNPDFTMPCTNDSGSLHLDEWLKNVGDKIPAHPVLTWVKSRRAAGCEPGGFATASRFMPWSGFIAMRSSWQADAVYGCFDVGPMGSGHWHFDKLNLILFAGSEELLYDDGGGFYEDSPQRHYCRTTAAHNSVLIDGQGQNHLLRRLDAPAEASFESNDLFDYACASYTASYGNSPLTYTDVQESQIKFPAAHTRSVRFCKPDFFCVQDFMESKDGLPHNYQARWQMDTLQVTALDEYANSYRAEYKEHDLLIITLSGGVTTQLLQGVLAPQIGGWYHGFPTCRKSTTLAVDFNGVNSTLHTLLIPVKHGAAVPEITRISETVYQVDINGKIHRFDLNAIDKAI